MGLLGDPNFAYSLVPLLHYGPRRWAPQQAAYALALLGRDEGLDVLAWSVPNTCDCDGLETVVGLALIGSPRARQALETAARESAHPAIRRLARRCLEVPARQAVEELLKIRRWDLDSQALSILTFLNDPASLPALEHFRANAPDNRDRVEAARTIKRIRRLRS